MAHRAHHFTAIGFDYVTRVFFKGVTKGVISGQKEPLFAALLDHSLGGAVGHGVSVVGPVHGHVIAVFVGHQGGGRARDQGDAVLFLGDLHDGQGHGGGDQLGSHVDFVTLKPLTGLVCGNVTLVLVVGRDHFDLEAGLVGLHEVLNGHLGGHHCAFAGDVRVQAGQIGQHTDLDDVVRDLGLCSADRGERQAEGLNDGFQCHDVSLWVVEKLREFL